jgi:hypothetical protein
MERDAFNELLELHRATEATVEQQRTMMRAARERVRLAGGNVVLRVFDIIKRSDERDPDVLFRNYQSALDAAGGPEQAPARRPRGRPRGARNRSAADRAEHHEREAARLRSTLNGAAPQ